ncbi:MAG: hypothetical protein Q9183_004655 [Haloplaca sp. 2 TL-2023]
MQFKNIVAFVSLAAMASAAPAENLVERTTPAQDAAAQCNANQTLKCCNNITNKLIAIIGIQLPIGGGCNDIDLLAITPLSAQCSQSQKVACCSSGDQKGLVNVGPVCPQIL